MKNMVFLMGFLAIIFAITPTTTEAQSKKKLNKKELNKKIDGLEKEIVALKKEKTTLTTEIATLDAKLATLEDFKNNKQVYENNMTNLEVELGRARTDLAAKNGVKNNTVPDGF